MWSVHLTLLLCLTPNVDPLHFPLIGSEYFSSWGNSFRLPVSYRPGFIGVNLLGFHASCGLVGGLLAEKGKFGTIGGPHAEASTPYGQSAGAGVGIRIENKTVIGYVYTYTQLGQVIRGKALLKSSQNGRHMVRIKKFTKKSDLSTLFD